MKTLNNVTLASAHISQESDPSLQLTRSAYSHAILAATLGTVVEFADWVIYIVFTPFIAKQFFADHNPATALLSALAIFAVGFIMRPIGGAVLGAYADRYGRKSGLSLSITLMAISSAVIGLCPTYQTIGLLAPCILVLARLLQGFSAGGESGSATTFLVESAPPGQRAFASAWQNIAIEIGVLVALVLGLVLTSVSNLQFFSAWGWRAGFLVAASLGLITLWIRRTISETAVFAHEVQPQSTQRFALREVLFEHPLAVLKVIGIACAGNLLFYTWLVSYASYVHLVTGTALRIALIASIISILLGLVVTPFVGVLADRIGRRPVLIIFAFGSALYAWPSMHFLYVGITLGGLILVQTPALLLLSGFTSTSNTAIAEQFPAPIRATGTGLAYAISVALFGGTAPYIFASFHSAGLDEYSWIYIVIMCLISGLTFLTMRETRDIEL